MISILGYHHWLWIIPFIYSEGQRLFVNDFAPVTFLAMGRGMNASPG